MTDKQSQKINIGPMPTQTDDYSHYEESELRWDRIVGVLIILGVVIYGVATFFSGDDEAPVQPMEPPKAASELTPSAELDDTVAVEKNIHTEISDEAYADKGEKTLAPAVAPQAEAAKEKATDLEPMPAQVVSEAESPQSKPEQEIQAQKENVREPSKDPIELFHPGIARAQLTSSLKDGQPVDLLSSKVAMNEEGIIKVVLYTEMQNLKGTWLRHIWYRNDVKQATVKVPVNYDAQRSSSSKFINAQMLGSWRVEVIDDQQQLYTQATFEVGSY